MILVGIRQLWAGIVIFIPVSLLRISHPRASTIKLIKNLVDREMIHYMIDLTLFKERKTRDNIREDPDNLVALQISI